MGTSYRPIDIFWTAVLGMIGAALLGWSLGEALHLLGVP